MCFLFAYEKNDIFCFVILFWQLHQRQSPAKDVRKNSLEHQQPDDDEQNSDTDDGDIVPIVIRPGHIRFEPLGKGLLLNLCVLVHACLQAGILVFHAFWMLRFMSLMVKLSCQ